MLRLEMKNCDVILTEKLQKYLSALSSGKIDKYEYFTGEEILPPDQSRVIKQTKFTYSSLGRALGKQIKTIKNQGEKQTKPNEEHVKHLVESNALIKKM